MIKNAIIYCDPPYHNTIGYGDFDYDKYIAWLRNQDNVIFCSEYSMPDDFEVLTSKDKVRLFNASNKNRDIATEKLFVHNKHKKQPTTLFGTEEKTTKTTKQGRYGLPYQGSKRAVAGHLLDAMHDYNPNATVFVDLFGGGGAMTFEALRRGYKVVYNEFNPQIANFMQFIVDQIQDKSKQSKYGIFPERFYEHVSHEKFEQIKQQNYDELSIEDKNYRTCILLTYSFGNCLSKPNYAYDKRREEFIKLGNDYCVHGKDIPGIPQTSATSISERRLFLNQYCKKEFARLMQDKDLAAAYQDYTRLINQLYGIAPKYTAEEKNRFCQWLHGVVKEKELKNVVEYKAMTRHYCSVKSQQEIPNKNEWLRIKNHLINEKHIEIPNDILELFIEDEVKQARIRQQLQQLQQLEQLQRLQRLEQLQQLQQLEQLQQLQRLEQLQQLQRLEQLQRLPNFKFSNLVIYNKSYDELLEELELKGVNI